MKWVPVLSLKRLFGAGARNRGDAAFDPDDTRYEAADLGGHRARNFKFRRMDIKSDSDGCTYRGDGVCRGCCKTDADG